MPNEMYTHVESGMERDAANKKMDAHISDVARWDRLARLAASSDFQEFLALRWAKDQELLALAGDDLFTAGRCVGRADVIMEIRADMETIKLKLQRASARLEAARPRQKV